MSALLEVSGLEAYYGRAHILQGVNFAMARGEVLALMGRNGAGKSTTMKALMGLVPPARGSVSFEGRRIDGRDKIAELRPDVLTLDIEMPRMDGLTFLEKLMTHFPLPVIIVSSLTPKGSELSMRALALGAVDVVPKPGSQFSIPDVSRDLSRAIRSAALARFPARRNSPSSLAARPGKAPITLSTTSKLLAIGSSTGGPRALEVVLGRLGANAPGTVIVQHMPEGFTRAFAERFAARNGGRYPTMSHAGTYSSTLAYLAAVKAVGSPKDGKAIVKTAADRDLKGVFTFPFFTIEDVMRVDDTHIMVANDNNLPFSGGREIGKAADNEFILLDVADFLAAK